MTYKVDLVVRGHIEVELEDIPFTPEEMEIIAGGMEHTVPELEKRWKDFEWSLEDEDFVGDTLSNDNFKVTDVSIWSHEVNAICSLFFNLNCQNILNLMRANCQNIPNYRNI